MTFDWNNKAKMPLLEEPGESLFGTYRCFLNHCCIVMNNVLFDIGAGALFPPTLPNPPNR